MESVPKEWLTVKAEIKEKVVSEPTEKTCERLRFLSVDNEQVISVDFAKSMFRDSMLSDDEIWLYSSPPESWQMLCGRSGYALVREGEVIDTFLTLMN